MLRHVKPRDLTCEVGGRFTERGSSFFETAYFLKMKKSRYVYETLNIFRKKIKHSLQYVAEAERQLT